MRPERLEFCGINSFSEKVIIDFCKLLAGGIFGIFGDTGSGKTTILDSMIFALYGKVDRARGGNGCEIINYNCDKAYVIFDFSMEEDGRRRIYRVEREIRRKNSQQKLSLSEREGNVEHVISDGVKNTNEKIRAIVGLSFEDFKKCIALPQGEFAQFVKEDRGERLRLISRLFDLEMYGDRLNAVLKKRFDAARSALDKKDGELSSYAEYTDETLAEQRADLVRLQNEALELNAAYERVRAEFTEMQAQMMRSKKWRDLRASREKLAAQEREMSAKRADQTRLPAATEIFAIANRVRSAEQQKKESESKCGKLSVLREEAVKNLEAIRKEIEETNAEAQLLALRERRAAVKHAEADAGELAKFRALRARAAEDYRKAESRRSMEEKALQKWEEEEKTLSQKLKEAAEASDLSAFLRGNLDSALLNAEYADAEEYFREKLQELKQDFTGGDLYDRVESALRERLEHYSSLRGHIKVGDLEQLLQKFRAIQAERTDLLQRLHTAQLKRTEAQGSLRAAEEERARATERGLEAKNNAEAALSRLRTALGDADAENVSVIAVRLQHQEEEILAVKSRREEEVRALEGRIHAFELEKTREEGRVAALERERSDAEQSLQAKLVEGGFTDEREAETLRTRYPDAAELAAELEEYDRRLAQIDAGIRAVEAEGEIVFIEESFFGQREREFKELTQKRESVGRQSAVLESAVARFAEKLARKKILEKERDELQGIFSNIERLRGLLYGNKFMEFVAGEYLSDISESATELLLKLTNGRYFIRYVQGFFVGDNFNGGELRSVNTLSGGETFLVSLSLALALSASIFAKSLRPIEFFFLDEGFGTLDEKLIDTVMDSLEKLKNKHFAIGLISHVEELKHRIDHKIVVTAASESGGSTIKISC